MSSTADDHVTFSDLSRHPKEVAERATRLGRVRVTHRDAVDFYLTAADRQDLRDESLSAASRLFLALLKHDRSARTLMLAMPDVFPWVRHLSEQETKEFTVELAEVLSDAAELDADLAVRETLAGWRATARIKADPAAYRAAQAPTEGDFGTVGFGV
ncbi:hypothetical protein [Nocardia sp. NPDC051750]|uniref:hypothetical protein n=1 Tax=Nocardia sp. NPDC051750 TaxID=3364325 RepID=UPI003797A2E4